MRWDCNFCSACVEVVIGCHITDRLFISTIVYLYFHTICCNYRINMIAYLLYLFLVINLIYYVHLCPIPIQIKTDQFPLINPVCFTPSYKKRASQLSSLSQCIQTRFWYINLKVQLLPFLPTHRPHNKSGLQNVHRLFAHLLLYMTQPPHSEMYQ